MGEAKRKRAEDARAQCPCGSGKPAGQCHYDGRVWHKPPAFLGLHALPQKFAVEKCYMKELLSCDGGVSGEHLISESVIRVLKADGDFSISGLPWLEAGEEKILQPKNLTANCLCSKHNSALSPLDDAARFFFAGLKLCLECEAASVRYLVSGHDLERWLLKTAKAFAVSKNFASGRQRLSGAFASDVQVLDMLDNPKSWPAGTGLYCVMNAGDTTQNHTRFQLAPYTNANGELSGFGVNMLGLDFVLMLEAPNAASVPPAKQPTFRPGRIVVTFAASVNCIMLSWEDNILHSTLSLSHMQEI